MKVLLISKREAAQTLSISVRGVERMIADGHLPAVRVRGAVRIPIEAIRKIAVSKPKPRDQQLLDRIASIVQRLETVHETVRKP
jgi:excisionase family DNA binding protein